jgi:Protein of unknown function (DUF3237)
MTSSQRWLHCLGLTLIITAGIGMTDKLQGLQEPQVAQTSDASALRSRLLFTIRITLHPTQELGVTPLGQRRIYPVSGGAFEGPRLRGSVRPEAGGDWLLLRSDGVFQQDVRMTLQTDDGALIYMSYSGVRHASADVSEKLARGENIDPSEYYLRTAPFFETAAPSYSWINSIVSIGVGERLANGVIYRIFEVL